MPFGGAIETERTMVRVRWIGVALGTFQVLGYTPNPGTTMPASSRSFGMAAIGVLVVANLVAASAIRRRRVTVPLGGWLFAADLAVVLSLIWTFSFEPYGTTWVILTVCVLEGAVRFQQPGALIPVVVAIPSEIGREFFRIHAFPGLAGNGFTYSLTGVSFRLGMMLMIALVAGGMARKLNAERARADARADESARLARRESDARREAVAFQEVILAGVSAEDLEDVLRSMIETIAEALGYERLVVLLRDDEQRLIPIALTGFDHSVKSSSVAVGEGVAGRVARHGRTEILRDVRDDPDYYCVDPRTASQITLPIIAGGHVIGILDVESSTLDAFDEGDRTRLERLCTQMGLVIENARLLSAERSTVERLQDLDRMKSDFVAIASHELRTPLTAMQGSIKTLRRGDERLTEADAELLLGVLDRQTERLIRVVEDLLFTSRIDAGGIRLSLQATDVDTVLRDTMDELGDERARVSLAVAADLPIFVSDPQRLGQVVRNLIENALKFSPTDTLVRVSVHHTRGTISLDVADQGQGIPADEVEHIFDRFHQVGGALRRRGDGLGLGLFISRRIVQALGGRIEVDSVEGRGATFRVSIPIVAEAAIDEAG